MKEHRQPSRETPSRKAQGAIGAPERCTTLLAEGGLQAVDLPLSRVLLEELVGFSAHDQRWMESLITFAGAVRDGDLSSTGNGRGFSGSRDLARRVELCAIVNARCGRCTEDCAYCVQSVHHSAALDNCYPLLEDEQLLHAAQNAEESGAVRFGIVTSGAALDDDELVRLLKGIERIATETSLKLCASLGMLGRSQLSSLRDAGVVRYHHNLETSRNHYSKICTTHAWEQRVETVRHARAAGLEICCGGIFNLGETASDRVDLAMELAALSPESVPLNFLDPRPGTPLADRPVMDSLEAVKLIALFKLSMPGAVLRLAGGRQLTLGSHQVDALRAGVGGLMIGDFLTTPGASITEDHHILDSAGLSPLKASELKDR